MQCTPSTRNGNAGRVSTKGSKGFHQLQVPQNITKNDFCILKKRSRIKANNIDLNRSQLQGCHSTLCQDTL